MLYFLDSSVSCNGLNVSNNEVQENSGIFVNDPLECSLSFSSFRNNTAKDYICIIFESNFNRDTYSITDTNIIENNQESSNYAIICVNSYFHLTMIHCSVFGNCETGIGNVFYAYQGTLTCQNCSIPTDQTNKVKATISAISWGKTSDLFINYYKYFETDECKAGIDIWSDITPVTPTPEPPQTPKQTMEANYISCYPCEDLCQTGDINFYRLLEYIFLLCCLHPNPAKDIWYDIQ